jgi:hypothetical protein
MEENVSKIETIIEKTVDYAKTSFELGKLKVIDKSLEVISTLIPHAIVIFLFTSFLFFLNLGLALWIGKILGQIYLGFFIVAGLYVIVGVFIHFFIHNYFKRKINNYIIKQVFK